MTLRNTILPVLLLLPSLAFGASKEVIELSRDVAQLQDQVRTLQRSFDERMAAMQVLMQQTLDASNKNGQQLAVTSENVNHSLAGVGAPIANVGSKMDGVQNDVSALRESVADLTSRMGRIQQQLTDVTNALKAIQTPAAPPPVAVNPAAAAESGAGSAPSVAPGGAPPVAATTLYNNALKDFNSGKAELALSEFQDYLKYYGNSDLAPNAQFYIGYLHYSQDQFDKSIGEFDRVLEAYPPNPKTPDAHYMKGKALFQLGQRNKAAKEFQAILEQYPDSDVAMNAKAQLRALGMNPGSSAPAPRKATRRR